VDLGKGTETVLVVDDEAMVKDLARDILKRQGYTVLTAGGGEEAVELYRKNSGSIAVVVLDILMPGVDGTEAFRRIRALDPRARVVVSSGYDQMHDADGLLREGAVAFVQKPYRIAELVRVVSDAIAKK
jgi:DNA-binding NtrC family response regulator